MSGLDLAGAHLSGADLSGANLAGCDLSAAAWVKPPVLAQANLSGAKFGTRDPTNANLAGAHMTGCELAGAHLAGANLVGADLHGANLANANLAGANLSGADVSGADLRGHANLSGGDLAGARFAASNMAGADLSRANLVGTDLSGMDLRQTKFSAPLLQSTDRAVPTSFAGSTIPFSVIDLNWSCLDLSATTIVDVPSDLSGLNASGARLPSHDFTGHRLNGANFVHAVLDRASFTSVPLRKAQFAGASLVGAAFTKAVLDQAGFSGAVLGGEDQTVAALFSYAYIANCDFSQSNLYGVSFPGATLIGNNQFSGNTTLQETNFVNAYMPNVDLTGAWLKGAQFDGAFMVECILRLADLSPTRAGSVRASLAGACLQGVTFDGAKFAGADLSNAALTAVGGSIMQQYFDDEGQLTPATAMNYPATLLPSAESLDAETICPNGVKFSVNQAAGRTLAEMMAASAAPTSWKPVGSLARRRLNSEACHGVDGTQNAIEGSVRPLPSRIS